MATPTIHRFKGTSLICQTCGLEYANSVHYYDVKPTTKKPKLPRTKGGK